MRLARSSSLVPLSLIVSALLLPASAPAQTAITYTTGQTATGTITNSYQMYFNGSSSAGAASITNDGRLGFNEASTAASAVITNNNRIDLFSTATAGSASITNGSNGILFFNGSSSAGSASITNNSVSLAFFENSSAGSASIVNNGSLRFEATSTGGTSRVTNNGTLDISRLTGASTTFGSFAGSGTFYLGSKAVTVGSTNTSTIVSGVLTDGGLNGGTGASLTKVGGLTLILTGANTYTGGTTVTAGILQIGDAGTSGSIIGDVVNNAELVFNRSSASTYAGAISGSGSMTKHGSGTLTLTGASTYTGGTTVAGPLQLGDGGTTGSITGDIINYDALTFNRSDAFTFGGAISGYGRVTMAGTGTLTLTGTNTYTGGTTLAAGTLALGSAGALGSSGTLDFKGGTLQYSAANTTDYSSRFSTNGNQLYAVDTNGQSVTFASALTGSSKSLTKSGTGTLTLAAANTHGGATTVNAGTLSLAHSLALQYSTLNLAGGALDFGSLTSANLGGLTGSSPLALTNASSDGVALTVRQESSGASTSYSGALSGSGSLIKAGFANTTLTLSGANSYTGGTTISAGTLAATHADALGVNGAVSIAFGATLNTGALANFTVSSLSGAGTINAGGGVFDVDQTADTTWAGNLTGAGRLRKTGTGTLTLTGTNTYTAATFFNAGTIVFNQLANFGPSGNLRFNGGTIKWAAGTSTDISSRVVSLETGASTFDTNGNNVTLASAIGNNGAGALVKTGAGTLSLAGTNTYTGGTTVNAGVVSFSSLASFGTGSLTLNGGGLQWAAGTTTDISSRLTALNFANTVFDTNGNSVTLTSGLSGTGALTKSGAGTLTLAGANTRTGGTTLAGGALALGHADALGTTGTISFTGGTLQFSAANTADYSSRLSSSAGQTYSINTDGQSVTFASALTSVGGSLTKLGTGTLTLTAANTYSGLTAVSAGFLDLSGSGRLTGAVQIGSQGTLRFQGGAIASSTSALTNQGNVSFHSDASAGSANFTNSSQLSFFNSATAGTANITNNNGNVTFDGTATAGSAAFTNDGGYVAFSGNATAGSAAFINNGNVDFYTAATAGSASFTNHGTVAFYDDSTAGAAHLTNSSYGQLYFSGNSTGGSATLINDGYVDLIGLAAPTITFGALAGSGAFNLSYAAVTVGSTDASTTLSGTLSDYGTASLTKVGTGTLALTAANTYGGGTTVSAGTLLANNTAGSAFGSGDVTVNPGATLGGSGTIAGLATFNSGARLAPGNSPGTLTFTGGLTLTGGSILDFELGTTSDLIRVSGGTLSGPLTGLVTINLSNSGGFTAGTYTLFDFTSAATSSFDLGDFAFGTTIPGYTYALAFAGSTLELSATASAIPEPSTYAALAGAFALGLAILRRRQKK